MIANSAGKRTFAKKCNKKVNFLKNIAANALTGGGVIVYNYAKTYCLIFFHTRVRAPAYNIDWDGVGM